MARGEAAITTIRRLFRCRCIVIHDSNSLRHAPMVFDSVLGEEARATLATTKPIRWALYDRQNGKPPRNAQERAIEGLLTELGDTSRWVEYWGRARWDSVPAHFDCDEGGLVANGVRRWPYAAHVLYLELKDENLRAPTVLWRPRGKSGSGGGSSSSSSWPFSCGSNGGNADGGAAFFTCPAVGGRLLRFCGEWVHGVPRPAREYLGEGDGGEEDEASAEMEAAGDEADDDEEEEEEEGEEEGEEGEEEGEEEEAEDAEAGEGEEAAEEQEEVRRLVLLFNSWPDAPPTPDGKSDSPEAAATGVPAVYEDDLHVKCAPRRSWVERGFESNKAEEEADSKRSTALVARMMGTPKRRGCAMRYRADDVAAPRSALGEALGHADEPRVFGVR